MDTDTTNTTDTTIITDSSRRTSTTKLRGKAMSETREAAGEELRERVLTIGSNALDLLRRFGLEQLSTDELTAQLPALGAGATAAEHWGLLISDPDLAPCLEILQLVSSLETEIRYQLQRYGATSLHEDFRELDIAVKRLKQRRATHGK